MLHPDRCDSDPARRLAELQIRRLNSVVATLSDPLLRSRYDRSLLAPALLAAPAPRARRWPRHSWIAAPVVLGAILLAALLPQAPSIHRLAPASAAIASPPAQSTAIAAKRPAKTTTKPAVAPAHRKRRKTEADLSRLPLPPDPIPDPRLDDPLGILPGVGPPSPPRVSQEAPPPRSSLAGEWLLLRPDAGTPNPGLYPPEYIELRLTQTGTLLHGRYRARYRVRDQAISPAVSFQFDGPAAAESATLPWTGPGGSSGTVTLRALPSGALEVKWVADTLGSQMGLISGTATLVRKLE